jgi:hypothetical protein
MEKEEVLRNLFTGACPQDEYNYAYSNNVNTNHELHYKCRELLGFRS